VFGTARWRLTISFTLVLGVILVVTGVFVYLTARATLLDQVNGDLESRVRRERPLLGPRLLGRDPNLQSPQIGMIGIGPVFTAGGYFYALVQSTGEVVTSSPSVDPAGLAGADTIAKAINEGDAYADTKSSTGDPLRVYIVRLDEPGGQGFLMEVGRSTEPEQQALERLLLVLIGGGGAGLLLALVGGYLLAGRALRPIQAATDSQRVFIADASHELRTPLSVIRANAELLKRHSSESISANHEAVDDIVVESDHLGKMVGQMLTLAQADAGRGALVLSEVMLNELAEEVARRLRLLAESRGVAFEADVDGPLPLRGDGDRLRELMTILADNAIKYTEAGGKVRLEVRRASGGKVTLRVSDTGCGIPAEALPHIFDRFYRVDKARSREAGGTGLGLAIARWIAEAHGGSIRAESVPGEGTTMTVELPV
jgi:two-component system sensor histidine kinase CiaH